MQRDVHARQGFDVERVPKVKGALKRLDLLIGVDLTDEFRSIWDKMGAIYERHASCDYEGMCGACDEYYTYNF